MAGKLIWLVGASGSGKDSLLAALRQREHPQLLVAHRYITRSPNAGGENHIALSEREFLPAPSSICLPSAGMQTTITTVLASRLTCGCTPGSTWSLTVHARTLRKRRRAMLTPSCLSVCRFHRRCSDNAWRGAGGRTKQRSPSAWRARRAIRRARV